jgi:hypothetical protein
MEPSHHQNLRVIVAWLSATTMETSMLYVRPEKIEFSYFPVYVFCIFLLYVFVMPDGVSKFFHLKCCNFLIRCSFHVYDQLK